MSTPAPERRGSEQRVTKQRLAVTAALGMVDDFVSAQELHRWLMDDGAKVSLATVYRLLQSLAEDGLVDVLRGLEGEAMYRQCRAEHHHHHLVCRKCGKAVEIEAPAVEAWATRVARENGFSDPSHTVEIYGLCPACTATAAAGAA
ncbi:Fur family transcriptional regulator [Paeniglutamicibacter cryotolerans]|uniref:Fur family ferric uptake transcriptional regulator n=1 Tax=Paeniglutamicibacter cryotolerans TaxID=670079 RepID=A0A839QWH0_9MICC|nr:Fur family transcriptional regulator [Paeniglutamicibacter cryotolerans]MBB2996351.1 Fur family ferric uptake transcriptional regulator [Paeniglutamicibacter cryotolerans]